MSSADIEKHTETLSARQRQLAHLKPWKPGVSPNPGGKPTKSRNALQGKFFKALAEDFDQHGKKAIIKAREDDPMGYIKTVASLMPKEFEITRALDEIPDEQLDAAVLAVRAILAAQDSGNGAGRAGKAQHTKGVPAIRETT